MNKKIIIALLFLVLNLKTQSIFAQTEPQDVAVVTDDFQTAFFESLKQKGIENYDKAIVSLEKCLKLSPDNDVVLFEMGKNYLLQKEFKKAAEAFENASKINPKNKWFLNGSYDVAFQTDDFEKAIEIVQKLIAFDSNFKEDLASLYMKTKQFDKALNVINQLNAEVGTSEKRELYKAQILEDPKMQGDETKNLINLIQKNPLDESNYLKLIGLYVNSGQDQKAAEITQKLETAIPTSDWTQVSLFKTFLTNNEGEKAVIAMNKVLSSNKIDNKIKHRILNEFLIFVKNNPKFNADLEHATTYFSDDKEVKVPKEIGKFYQNKKDWDNAILYFELDQKSNPNDIQTALLLLEAYRQKLDFDNLSKKAVALIELFPLQPDLYFYGGLANNQLKNFKKAKEILESGIDYLVDNIELEIGFDQQLSEAYGGLGDLKKKEMYLQKANQLAKSKKQ